MIVKKRRLYIACVIMLGLMYGSCKQRANVLFEFDEPLPGKPHSFVHLGHVTKVVFRVLNLVSKKIIPGNSIVNGANLYRLTYWTTGVDGHTIPVSALVSVPDTKNTPDALVLYLHGTNVNREAAPSRPSMYEGVVGSMVFSSSSNVLLMPDYIGLGVSQVFHPYLNLDVQTRTVLDAIKAANSILDDCLGVSAPSSLLVAGFSQGGRIALSLHRALEKDALPGMTIAATAAISGPHVLVNPSDDPDSIYSFEHALFGDEISHALYVSYIGVSLVKTHQLSSVDVFAPEWAEQIMELFDGNHTVDEICGIFLSKSTQGKDCLAVKPFYLLSQQTRDDYMAYKRGERATPLLVEYLSEPDLLDWIPKRPLRFYYGEKDADVVPMESIYAVNTLGGLSKAINLGPLCHDETVYTAIPEIKIWWKEINSAY